MAHTALPPAGPASCNLPRAKHLCASQQGSRVPMPTRSCPASPALLPGPGCPEQLSPGMELHRGFTGTSKPHAQGESPRWEKQDRAPVPAAFRGAPGRCRWLARAARAPSQAGRGSICFAAPQGFLNRSLLFYSLWDLEKPVVPDNLWTHQHCRSGGSPGARRRPPRSSSGGPAPPAELIVSWESGWGARRTLSRTLGSLLSAKGNLSLAVPDTRCPGGAFPPPCSWPGVAAGSGLCPGTVCSQSQHFPFARGAGCPCGV